MNSFYVIFVTIFTVAASLPVHNENDLMILTAESTDLLADTPLILIGVTDDVDAFNGHLERVRRQIYGGVTPGNPGGVNAMIGARGTLYQNPNHRLDGHAQVSKNLYPTGPTNVQGGLDYTGRNTGASVGASHTHGYGTGVNAAISHDLWRSNDGSAKVTGSGTYDRHFGGPYGTGRPQYGGSLMYSRRF